MVSGLAPGSDADTEIVGKSTCGSGDTGNRRKAAAPASASPMREQRRRHRTIDERRRQVDPGQRRPRVVGSLSGNGSAHA